MNRFVSNKSPERHEFVTLTDHFFRGNRGAMDGIRTISGSSEILATQSRTDILSSLQVRSLLSTNPGHSDRPSFQP